MTETRKTGAELITAERQRQIDEEGYTEADDRFASTGQLARAALSYALPLHTRPEDGSPPREWPWDDLYWKPCPGDRVRELVKAGALFRAEADRLMAGGEWFNVALPDALSSMQSCAKVIDDLLASAVSA